MDTDVATRTATGPQAHDPDASRGRSYWDADIAMTEAAARVRTTAPPATLYEDSLLDLTCFVSCYNEAEYIADTLATIAAAAREAGRTFEIIVIDDCSADDSAQTVRDYIAAHPDVNVVLRANKQNKGLAQNYVDCAFMGTGKYYRLFCGDNAEPKDTLVTLMGAVGEADCIVPYRSTDGRNAWRQLVSSTYTWIINAITGNRLRYYNGSSVHLRHNVMRWHTNTRGFGFQAEILCLLLDLGFSYKEINIVAEEQRQGKSNALTARNLLSVAHTIIEIANRRLSSRVYKSR
jgi:glycosyltransferase involved in cell wall biosynthesis